MQQTECKQDVFDEELNRLEQLRDEITRREDLKSLLLRITALQRVVYEELCRRKRAPLQ